MCQPITRSHVPVYAWRLQVLFQTSWIFVNRDMKGSKHTRLSFRWEAISCDSSWKFHLDSGLRQPLYNSQFTTICMMDIWSHDGYTQMFLGIHRTRCGDSKWAVKLLSGFNRHCFALSNGTSLWKNWPVLQIIQISPPNQHPCVGCLLRH